MDEEQVLSKLESHFRRILSEVGVFKSLYSDRAARPLLDHHLHDLLMEIQRPLIDSIVMSICRMLDPAASFRRDNITLFYLADIMTSRDQTLRDRIDALKAKIQPLKILRDRIIGHSDLAANSIDRIDYTGASHDEITENIALIREILDRCSVAIRGATVVYEARRLDDGGPEALKTILRQIHTQR